MQDLFYCIIMTFGVGREHEVFRNVYEYAEQDQHRLESSVKNNDKAEAVNN